MLAWKGIRAINVSFKVFLNPINVKRCPQMSRTYYEMYTLYEELKSK